jgi:hypothetical protein
MRCTIGAALGLVGAGFAAQAAPSAEVLDLAGRVHYGYYHDEPRTIEAAIEALDRLGESPVVLYYRDFATLRLAQLGAADRSTAARLQACAERDAALGLDKRATAEAWVLVAACAEVAADDGRRERALALARERDEDNPRIALVEGWALARKAGNDAVERDAVAAKLAAVVEAFDAWSPPLDDPDWGYAEALTGAAAAALERGQARTARDLIERALLLAPEYGAALDLRVTMQNARGGDRAP